MGDTRTNGLCGSMTQGSSKNNNMNCISVTDEALQAQRVKGRKKFACFSRKEQLMRETSFGRVGIPGDEPCSIDCLPILRLSPLSLCAGP